jgi:hypothetical protein
MTALKNGLECLTLAFPEALEEEVADLCHSVEGIGGFTMMSASGFGSGAALRSASEAVLGRAARKILITVAAPERLMALIDTLSRELPTPDVAYWITPVHRFGRLA